MLPACALYPAPRGIHVAQVYWARGRREDEAAWLEHLVGRLGGAGSKFFLELFPIDGPFGGGLVASRLNKFPEFGIGNVVLINPEAID
jgi:hypothetical protein